MVVVDTSFLVALHFEGDRFHEKAVSTRLAGDRFLIPAEVWVEYADVAMRLSPDRVQDVIRSTLEGPFDVQQVFAPAEYEQLAGRAAQVRERLRRTNRKPLSFYDVVVCAAAERYREAILSFDEGMRLAVRDHLFPGARLAN